MKTRVTAWRAITAVASLRVWNRIRERHTWVTITGVAIPVALMILVMGMGAGFSAADTHQSGEYVITSESGPGTTAFDVGNPQLGSVHDVTTHVESREDVTAATPALEHISRVETGNGESSEYVLVLGVIPADGHDDLVGLSTANMTPGDPYFETGERTEEAVISQSTASLMGLSTDDDLTVADRSFTVVGVDEAQSDTVLEQVPVVVVHLSELQEMTGADTDDRADEIIVHGEESDDLESFLADIYPEATVTSGDSVAELLTEDDLALSMSLAAAIIAVVVGSLFVATTLGMVVARDRQHVAVLAAIGLSQRARTGLVLVQTVWILAIAAVVAIVLSIIGTLTINTLVGRQFSVPDIILIDPQLWLYGVGTAMVIGCLTAPYLIFLSRQTPVTEVLRT